MHLGCLTRSLTRPLSAIVLLLAAVLAPAPVSACFFRPACNIETLPVAGTVLPANVETLALRTCVYGMPSPALVLSAERDGRLMTIDIEVEEATHTWSWMGEPVTGPLDYWMLHIRSPLRPGDKLILHYRAPLEDDAGVAELELSWQVGEERALPESLGTLDVQQDVGIVTIGHNTSCSRKILSSYADVALQPAADAKAWLDGLRYELRVDGDEPWVFYDSLPGMGNHFWNSALGPGKDRLVVGCEAHPLSVASLSAYRRMPVLVPGEHRVRMVGVLPNGRELSSEEVVLDMTCPPGSSGPIFDAGVMDAGGLFSENDNFQEEARAAEPDASCSVLTPGHAHRSWIVLLLMAAIVSWRKLSGRGAARSRATRLSREAKPR